MQELATTQDARISQYSFGQSISQFGVTVYSCKFAKQGKKGHIRAKMNSLVDPEIIQLLYLASQAGVKVELIVRGFCCLKPGIKGLSENIEVISIIGRFLEHSRIYYFSGGKKSPMEGTIYIGSADWMWRNLMGRVEVMTPLLSDEVKLVAWNTLKVNLEDQFSSWVLTPTGKYEKKKGKTPGKGKCKGTHETLMRELEKSAD